MNEQPQFFSVVAAAWKDIVVAMAIAFIYGSVSHLYRIRCQHPSFFSVTAFLVDVGVSGLVGFIAFMYCMDTGVSPWMTGPIVGISSHAAPRLIFLGDYWIARWVHKKADMDEQ